MVDPGIIALGLAGLVAVERIFSRIRESRCMGIQIRNSSPPSTPPVSEPVELGPVLGSGRRLPSPPPHVKESSPR